MTTHLHPQTRPTERPATRAATALVIVGAMLGALAVFAPGAEADPIGPLDYVALGDSYSSGEGLPPFVADSGACNRSDLSYPFQVERPGGSTPLAADTDPETTFTSVACSGATIPTLRSTQISSVNADTDLVTVSIGGNDAGFVPLLDTCLKNTCATIDFGPVDALLEPLTQLYTDLRAGGATVAVTGYPQLFEHPTSCTNTVVLLFGFIPFALTLDQNEWDNGRLFVDRLNDVTRTAAARAGVHYVDVSAQFTGHGLRATDPWVNNLVMDSATVANPKSFHPTQEGQHQYALAVNQYLDDQVGGGAPTNPVTGLPLNPDPDPTATTTPPLPTTGNLTTPPAPGSCGGFLVTSPGEAVVVTGSGFKAATAATVTLSVGGTDLVTVPTTASATGTIAVPVTIPFSVGDTIHPAAFTAVGTNPAGATRTSTGSVALDFALPGCDLLDPTISLQQPNLGMEAILGSTVNAAYTCADDRVLTSCGGTVPSGQPINTSSVGMKGFTATAIDASGNSATRSSSYRVVYLDSYGGASETGINTWASPTSGPIGVFTMPVTLRTATGTVLTATSGVTSAVVHSGGCLVPGTFLSTPATVTNSASQLSIPGTGLRIGWAGAASQVFVNQCFRIVLTLNDGTTHQFTFKRTS